MKFVIRRVAAMFAALGITGMIGAYLNGMDPFNAGYLVLVAGSVLLVSGVADK